MKLQNPTKDDILKIVHSIEASRNVENTIIKQIDVHVDKISAYRREKMDEKKAKIFEKHANAGSRCSKCDRFRCKGNQQCFAYGKPCNKCGEKGHFKTVCNVKSINIHDHDEELCDCSVPDESEF